MLALSARPRVFLSLVPKDMRCSFQGLSSRTKSIIKEDPLSGYLFAFLNRKQDYVKVLHWDESGYCIWCKKLEAGSFEVPASEGNKVEIDVQQLLLILEGISLKSVKKRKRFLLKKEVRWVPEKPIDAKLLWCQKIF